MELLWNGHGPGGLLPPLLSLPPHKGHSSLFAGMDTARGISLQAEDACTASLDEAACGNCKAGLLAGISCQLFHTLSAEGVALDASDSNAMRCLGGKKTGTKKVIGQSREMEPVGQKHPKEKLRR